MLLKVQTGGQDGRRRAHAAVRINTSHALRVRRWTGDCRNAGQLVNQTGSKQLKRLVLLLIEFNLLLAQRYVSDLGNRELKLSHEVACAYQVHQSHVAEVKVGQHVLCQLVYAVEAGGFGDSGRQDQAKGELQAEQLGVAVEVA